MHPLMTASMHDGRSCSSRWSGSTLTYDYANSHLVLLGCIRDNGIALYKCVSIQGYEDCQSDILAVSEMGEDIRDALLEYQVSCERSYVAVASLSFTWFQGPQRPSLHLLHPCLSVGAKCPTFRSILIPLLESNPDVVHESLYTQMGKLIVEPLRSADLSTVMVVDVLDECKDEGPSSVVLSVLGQLVDQIPWVKFFTTRRPEPRIKTGFRLPLLVDVTDVFTLHNVHPLLINNYIRLFLKHGLSKLAQRR